VTKILGWTTPLPVVLRRRLFFNSVRRRRRQFVGGGALLVTFLPLKWLGRILATFHNNYMPAIFVWIYLLTLTPVFRPTYLTHAHFC